MADRDAAKGIIDTGIAALTLWAASIKTDEPLTVMTASPFQLSARVIHEYLDDAEKGMQDSDTSVVYAAGRDLVYVIEQSLWNFMCRSSAEPPCASHLARTAHLALDFLGRASASLGQQADAS